LPFYYAYEADYAAAPGGYWRALLGSHVLGWAFIVFASWFVTRTWQDKEITSGPARLPGSRRGLIRRGNRRRLLEQNPVAWLIGKERGAQWLVWMIVIVWSTAVTIATCILNSAPPWLYQGAKISGFLLKLLIASQACRFFAESRGNGMLELLLCTPLRSIEILRGQWLALQRTFLWPLLVFVLFHFVPVALAVYRSLSDAGWNTGVAQILSTILGFGALAGFGLYFLADVYAICWFGAWLALTSKKPAMAPLWTILFVVIIPSPLCFLCIIADLFFILWAVIKLLLDFRWLLSNQYQTAPNRIMPALPPPPPVIPDLASRPR
jgi:hypothetical protein